MASDKMVDEQDIAAAQTEDKQGPVGSRLTVARTLGLGSAILLSLFIAAGFLSFYSVRSIGSSFDDVVSVDQPVRDAATDMIGAADATSIAFLESLVANERIPSSNSEAAFTRYMSHFQALVQEASLEEQGAQAGELFTRLKGLGRELMAADLKQQRSFLRLQMHFEGLDNRNASEA